jgi:hypothetical protein
LLSQPHSTALNNQALHCSPLPFLLRSKCTPFRGCLNPAVFYFRADKRFNRSANGFQKEKDKSKAAVDITERRAAPGALLFIRGF